MTSFHRGDIYLLCDKTTFLFYMILSLNIYQILPLFRDRSCRHTKMKCAVSPSTASIVYNVIKGVFGSILCASY